MFFKRLFLVLLLFGIVGLWADVSNEKAREQYMLRGQAKEKEQAKELAAIAMEKSGLFVGGFLGNITLKSAPSQVLNLYPLVYGVRVGYQKYLNNYIAGLRFYGEYARADTQKGFYQLGSANLDLMVDVPLSEDKKYALGIFGGVGMGWAGFSDKNSFNTFGMVIDLGIALTLEIRHRIELELKIPPESFNTGISSSNLYFIGYSFLF